MVHPGDGNSFWLQHPASRLSPGHYLSS
jgi:hypothetical protein